MQPPQPCSCHHFDFAVFNGLAWDVEARRLAATHPCSQGQRAIAAGRTCPSYTGHDDGVSRRQRRLRVCLGRAAAGGADAGRAPPREVPGLPVPGRRAGRDGRPRQPGPDAPPRQGRGLRGHPAPDPELHGRRPRRPLPRALARSARAAWAWCIAAYDPSSIARSRSSSCARASTCGDRRPARGSAARPRRWRSSRTRTWSASTTSGHRGRRGLHRHGVRRGRHADEVAATKGRARGARSSTCSSQAGRGLCRRARRGAHPPRLQARQRAGRRATAASASPISGSRAR